jgi:hypothetical protein
MDFWLHVWKTLDPRIANKCLYEATCQPVRGAVMINLLNHGYLFDLRDFILAGAMIDADKRYCLTHVLRSIVETLK